MKKGSQEVVKPPRRNCRDWRRWRCFYQARATEARKSALILLERYPTTAKQLNDDADRFERGIVELETGCHFAQLEGRISRP